MSQTLRIIASPAKKMRVQDAPPWPVREAAFLGRSEELACALRGLTLPEAQGLWRCSDRLAVLNYERLRGMDLTRGVTAAAVAYEGIQYQHLAAGVMDERELAWLDTHLRILSGLYGMLRPLDGVVPYRLEMQARLSVGDARDLYAFWGDALYEALARECDLVVNVASVEYARAVTRWVRPDGPQILTCLFGTMREGRLRQCATEAKTARGTFIRWCAERGAQDPAELEEFDQRGYALDRNLSDEGALVFVRATSSR
jgi:cytoplasmic iron level regulating protein YaaA (DUF328/UPF0246 family)